MARPVTAKFEELILEVEFTPGSGTYSNICGLVDASINRGSEIGEARILDCDDESLPLSVEKSKISLNVSVTASGWWALSSHERMMDWYYGVGGGEYRNIRLRNVKAEVSGSAGDTIIESGPAILESLNNERKKDGGRVTADVSILFNGTPERTLHG